MARTHRTTRPNIPSKIRSNSKRAHSEILQRENSQHIPRNQMKRRVKIQLAHIVFFYKQPIFRKFLQRSNWPIPRYIQPRVQIHYGRLRPRRGSDIEEAAARKRHRRTNERKKGIIFHLEKYYSCYMQEVKTLNGH